MAAGKTRSVVGTRARRWSRTYQCLCGVWTANAGRTCTGCLVAFEMLAARQARERHVYRGALRPRTGV